MRYYIDLQQSFASVQIKDENDTVLYMVKSKKGIHMGYQVSFVKPNEEVVYIIEKKGLSGKYRILEGEKEIGSIKSAFSVLSTKVKIESVLGSFEVNGKINKHKYDIIKNGSRVVSVSKKAISLKNQYFFDSDVKDGIEFLFVIAIILDNMAYEHQEKMRNVSVND